MGQLSFYSADARPRALSDLEGVLCAAGEVTVFGRGAVARLSIVLGDPPEPLPADEGQLADEQANGDREPAYRPVDHDGGAEERGAGGEADSGGDASDAGAEERGAGDGGDEGDGSLDPDDFAFLDLDPDELAAALTAPRREPEPPPGPPAPEYECDPVAEWRAQALCCAFAARGVEAEIERADDGRPVVRSAYRADLADLAREWTKGPEKAAPADLELDGPRLRLWVLAAGRVEGRAYVLGLDPAAADHVHELLLTASRHAGLGAVLGGAPGRPVLRIVGRRRRRRLAELVGRRPRAVAEGIWPDEWSERLSSAGPEGPTGNG